MGLTIHYALSTECTEVESVRALVQQMHQMACRLPFQEVGNLLEFHDAECRHDDRDDPQRWLKIQAGQYVQFDEQYLKVAPLDLMAFTAIPGAGCEPANFGLCRYPEFVETGGRRLATNLPGWSWRSFCKTQYATNSACGGIANFIRCHLSIVELLDAIRHLQIANVEVNDESHYWQHRDVRKLTETVGEWNEMIAAVAGQIKDAVDGLKLEAPITQFPDFEHLEAKGRTKLNEPPA